MKYDTAHTSTVENQSSLFFHSDFWSNVEKNFLRESNCETLEQAAGSPLG